MKLPTKINGREVKAAVSALGIDPTDAVEVILRPDEVIVLSFVRAEDGSRILIGDQYAKRVDRVPVLDMADAVGNPVPCRWSATAP